MGPKFFNVYPVAFARHVKGDGRLSYSNASSVAQGKRKTTSALFFDQSRSLSFLTFLGYPVM